MQSAYPQPYCCEESDHTWAYYGQVAIAVPEESAKVHRFASDHCTTCGAIRRACGPDGEMIPEIDADA